MDIIKSVIGFQDQFNTEEKCWEYLKDHRWPDGFKCPKCDHNEAYFIETRNLFQCKKCKHQTSVTAGTIFHGTRTPLRSWFWAILNVSKHKNGISANQLQKDVDIKSYDTAWHILHRIRSALKDPDEKYQLTSLVEVDEAYVGGKAKGKRGRGAEKKTIVEVAVENRGKHAGSVKMKVVQNVSSESLMPMIEQEVKKDSTVCTDGWQAYNDLGAKGFKHKRIVQSSTIPPSVSKTPVSEIHTIANGDKAENDSQKEEGSKTLPWVHIIIGNLKNWVRGTHRHVNPKYLSYYLYEFCYRLNRRWRELELFGFMIRRCARGEPLYYKVLIAERTG
jgi:transposase-like protein